MRHSAPVLIRRERPTDIDVIRDVTAAAFTRPGEADGSVEASLVDRLRAGDAWLPELSLVATDGAGQVVGHVLATRAHVAGTPVLAIGPLSVAPGHQRAGVGTALVHTALGACDALGAPLVVLLGDPRYYERFGFRLAEEYGITPAVAEWRPHFQVRTLGGYDPADPALRGAFAYAQPFDDV